MSDLTTAAATKASDVLTVWRKLHVEIDSMGPIPTQSEPPAPPVAEANVVKGYINSIEGNGTFATKVFVNQNLDDGSPMLPNPDPTVTSGWFEKGQIMIGTGSQAKWTMNLRGNGVENGMHYVEKLTAPGFDIPYAIVRSGTVVTSGQVVALAGTTFTVTGSLSSARVGDDFRLPGVNMTIQSISTQNKTVTVQQLVDIRFELKDDDTATHPFNVDTSLMQEKDDATLNLFAPAYVQPVYGLGSGGTQPSFDLNVKEDEECDQLSSGRNKAK
jgi:hypothetical protein